jgi:hypothetical protein
MFYFIGLLISLAAGFLVIRLLTAGRLNLILHLLLALGLGLGIDGTVTFYTHILFNQFNRWIPIGIVMLGIGGLSWQLKRVIASPVGAKQSLKKKKKAASLTITAPTSPSRNDMILGLAALGLLAIPLAVSGHYYPLGGWDAWSCWNLKAKFIFEAHENWKDMLAPSFWRSNTNYPLLWPLINVWFFDLSGHFDQAVPMLNSIVITLLTAGLLIFGLLELTGLIWLSISAAVLITALPLTVTLYTSQYSDALLGAYWLSAFIALLLAEKYELPKLKILSMIFLGLMAFTKNEGLIASLITALGLLWHERNHKKELKTLIFAFLIALLPEILFMLFISPKNEAFINGLTSAEKPTNWARLSVILAYPWFEFISAKWNGFWLLVLAGIFLGWKKLWQSTLGLMAASLFLYLGVVMAYYAMNTFFEIGWWLSTTLSRILFALLPVIVLWICLGLNKSKAA